jgi:hypothetical protein
MANEATVLGQRADGTIVLGGARWAAPDRDEGYYAEEVNPAVQDALERFLRDTFPTLRDLRVARRWAGIMGFSADGYPFIGPMPGRPRLQSRRIHRPRPHFALAGRARRLITTGGARRHRRHRARPAARASRAVVIVRRPLAIHNNIIAFVASKQQPRYFEILSGSVCSV